MDKEIIDKFNTIYDETFKDISYYVVLKCNNIEDVHDIIQNIYLGVLKILKKNNNVDINLSYILGIANHKIKDYYRFKYKIKNVLYSDELLEGIPNEKIKIEDDFINEADINLIWKYLKTKPALVSKVFYLYYHEDLMIKEISDSLNISVSNVKNILYRTLKELKIYIFKEGNL